MTMHCGHGLHGYLSDMEVQWVVQVGGLVVE